MRVRRTRALRAVLLAALVSAVTPVGGDAAGAQPSVPERTVAPPQQGAVPDISNMGWVPVLNDEFDQGALNESIWNVREGNWGGWNSRDAVRIEPDPGESGDGLLTLTTYTENGRHYKGIVQTANASFGDGHQESLFTSAYGYVEARVKLHTAPKTWSAFWLLPVHSNHSAPLGDPWNAGPEIDIFETGNPGEGDGEEDPDGACDWQTLRYPCMEIAGGTLHTGGFDEDHAPASWSTHWTGPSPEDEYINYGLLWTPEGYRMYRNGIEVFHSDQGRTFMPEQLILSQHIREWDHPDYGSLASSPYKMSVDYVKVWQRPISDIPDRTVPANSTLAIPFSVTDYATTGIDDTPETERNLASVDVTASSSNTGLVRNEQIVVTGNGPTPPQSALANPGFEGLASWTPSGAAPPTASTAKKRSGSSSLRLTKPGGRVQQTFGGLQPNTTYVLGGFQSIEVDWTDSNGNGKVDPQEPIADGEAYYDYGIVDIDASAAGDQTAINQPFRSASHEAGPGTSPLPTTWRGTSMTFATGPDTTSVTAFIDNTAYAGTSNDSNVNLDDVYVRPLIPANRTVTIRPSNGAAGNVDITLTATLEATDGTTIKTFDETFTVTFAQTGSFTNGGFESLPVGSGWQMIDHGAEGAGSAIIVDDPFTLDRALEVGGPSAQPQKAKRALGTVYQTITGLVPGETYDISASVRGNSALHVQAYDGSNSLALPFNSTTNTTVNGSFTMGATNTTANVLALDWDPNDTVNDGVSVYHDITVTPAASGGDSIPAVVSPTLASLHNQPRTIAAGAPTAIGFSAPDGSTITSVTSSNQLLVPDRNLGAKVDDPSGNDNLIGVLSLTPQGDQTGKADVTVTYGPGTQTSVIKLNVVDGRLVNPGFEPGMEGWTLPSGSSIVGGGEQTQGAGALRIDGSAAVTQRITGLAYNTPYVLEAATKGGVDVSVATVPDDQMKGNDGTPFSTFLQTYNASWTGAAWGQNRLDLATTHCESCRMTGSLMRYLRNSEEHLTITPGGQLDVTFTDANPGDGQPVYVDDLRLMLAPRLDRIPELSIAQTDSTFGRWRGNSSFSAGRVPMNARHDPSQLATASSDTTLLPTSNLTYTAADPRHGYEWQIRARGATSDQATGRSTVTVTAKDPGDPTISTSKSFDVTVNAGNNFRQGDFERTSGWIDGWFNLGWEYVAKQSWRHIAPEDADQVLRISSGVVGYKITGLEAGERYVVQANALGSGSTVEVYANTVTECNDAASANTYCLFWWGESRGSVAVNRTTWGPVKTAANLDLEFETIPDDARAGNQTDVYLVIRDADLGDGPDADTSIDDPPYKVPASNLHCAVYAAGETCIDDIGVFKATDVGL